MRPRRLGRLGYLWRMHRLLRVPMTKYSPANDMAALPFPKVIQLQTINACQAACTMCPYPTYSKVFARGRMDDALFDKITDEIAGRPEVDTFIPMLQNEPFLDKKIFDRIRSFKRKSNGRVKVELVTNGAFLSDENIAQIRESGLDLLDISLDAVSREAYAKIRIGLDFDDVMSGVNRVIDAKLPNTEIFVRLVRQKENVHEAAAFAAHWRSRGVSVFMYNANNRVGAIDGFDERVRIPARQEPLLNQIGRRASRAVWMRHCPIPFSYTNILHNGDLLMCVHDWARKDVIGNVRDHSIAELWNGPRMREIRAAVHARQYDKVSACRDCSLWRDGWF